MDEEVPELTDIEVPLNIREIILIGAALSAVVMVTYTTDDEFRQLNKIMNKLIDVGKLLPIEEVEIVSEELRFEAMMYSETWGRVAE